MAGELTPFKRTQEFHIGDLVRCNRDHAGHAYTGTLAIVTGSYHDLYGSLRTRDARQESIFSLQHADNNRTAWWNDGDLVMVSPNPNFEA
jgi:hypothetical protein